MPTLSKKLIIVESPTKAKTIRNFLKDENLLIEACYGHVRDLPNSAKDIPASYKAYPWATLGIDTAHNFTPLFVVPKEKTAVITKLKKLLKEVDELYLATDEDREGESISWHLLELLKPKVPVKRMVFHEITQEAIVHAFENTRELNLNLVNAQEARRLVDRLYGYSLSPLLWKKIAYGLSAGRVQSAGLRMLIEQEEERLKFKKAFYHSLETTIKTPDPISFDLIGWQGKKIATSRHIDPYTGQLNDAKAHWLGADQAKEWCGNLKGKSGEITEVTKKTFSVEPPLPFITSSLQQEANRLLGLSSRETMRVAQGLYEEGFITYMRTDSHNLSDEAKKTAGAIIIKTWGKEALNPNPKTGRKSKGAQEAHEAIRPAGSFKSPDKSNLSGAGFALYRLIYNRTLASLMFPAQKESTKYTLIAEKDFEFSASGVRVVSAGFLVLYPEKDSESSLPELKKGDNYALENLSSKEHETKPPSRYTEAGLIARLEKEGIGRPSTYASIIGVLLEREYVYKVGQTLIPTFMGMAVIKMLRKHFRQLIDYHFTSGMEDKLDLIAEGQFNKLDYLSDFYLGKNGLESRIEQEDSSISATESRLVLVMSTANGEMDVKVNRSGAYLSWQEDGKAHTLGLDSKTAPSDLNLEKVEELRAQQEKANAVLGTDPISGLPVYFRVGKYGAYLQVGEVSEDKDAPKPRTARLPKGATPETLSWESVLKELALPRIVGNHPETGLPITASKGPFGGFIAYDDLFISVKPEEKLYTITVNECLPLIEDKRAKDIKNTLARWDLGNLGEAIVMRKGRFGLFLKVGKDSIPLGKTIIADEISAWSAEYVANLWKDRKKKTTKKK